MGCNSYWGRSWRRAWDCGERLRSRHDDPDPRTLALPPGPLEPSDLGGPEPDPVHDAWPGGGHAAGMADAAGLPPGQHGDRHPAAVRGRQPLGPDAAQPSARALAGAEADAAGREWRARPRWRCDHRGRPGCGRCPRDGASRRDRRRRRRGSGPARGRRPSSTAWPASTASTRAASASTGWTSQGC